MKLTDKTKLTFLFWICLMSQILNAQSIQKVTPFNAVASANEIVEMFGDLINVTASDIETFYQEGWTSNPFNLNCPSPDASITEVNNVLIEFDWTLPTGGTLPTTVRYMDGFHLFVESLSLGIFVPEFRCLFTNQSCGSRWPFSIFNAFTLGLTGTKFY